jgi:hypothetical protein
VPRARQGERKRDGGKEGGREIESEEGGREGEGAKAYVCLPPVKIDRERQFKGETRHKKTPNPLGLVGKGEQGRERKGKEDGHEEGNRGQERAAPGTLTCVIPTTGCDGSGRRVDRPANKVKVPPLADSHPQKMTGM